MTLDPPLCVPLSWQRIDFISDLHLDASELDTYEAWVQYMATTPANALFILGDLFEVWVGDDNTDPFALQCQTVLKTAAKRMAVYLMCGNRDFLLGPDFFKTTGIHRLNDPTVLEVQPDTRFLLSHGDSLCLDDHDYLAFRAEVRRPEWQQHFLAKPLAEREAFARELRRQSEARKKTQTDYADVDTAAALDWLTQANAEVLIHGHTHKPAEHDLGANKTRWVLSDWHANATPARLEVVTWLRDKAQDTKTQSPSKGLCRLQLS